MRAFYVGVSDGSPYRKFFESQYTLREPAFPSQVQIIRSESSLSYWRVPREKGEIHTDLQR